jgi:hypothetical protein
MLPYFIITALVAIVGGIYATTKTPSLRGSEAPPPPNDKAALYARLRKMGGVAPDDLTNLKTLRGLH